MGRGGALVGRGGALETTFTVCDVHSVREQGMVASQGEQGVVVRRKAVAPCPPLANDPRSSFQRLLSGD